MRVLPYRTLDNAIEGAVLTFVDITEQQKADEALKAANNNLRLAAVVRDAIDALTVQDLTGRVIAWNPAAERIYGWTEDEALTSKFNDRIPVDARDDELSRIKQLIKTRVSDTYTGKRVTKESKVLRAMVFLTALVDDNDVVYGFATTERIIGSDHRSDAN